MSVTVGVNYLSVVHAGSDGVAVGFPDTCDTPTGTGVDAPIPYPNIAQSSDLDDGTGDVQCDGEDCCVESSNFDASNGDEAGVSGGVISGDTSELAEPTNYAQDVKFEGDGVVRALDVFTQNDSNAATAPVLQGPVVVMPKVVIPTCLICGKPMQ